MKTFAKSLALLTALFSVQAYADVVEIVHLKLQDGVTYEQFTPVDKAVGEQHVAKQKGFISREAMKGENGDWAVVVHWQSVADAEASMQSFAQAKAAGRFMSMIKPETMSMTRYQSTTTIKK